MQKAILNSHPPSTRSFIVTKILSLQASVCAASTQSRVLLVENFTTELWSQLLGLLYFWSHPPPPRAVWMSCKRKVIRLIIRAEAWGKYRFFFPQKIKYRCSGNVFSIWEKRLLTMGTLAVHLLGVTWSSYLKASHTTQCCQWSALLPLNIFPLVAASEGPVEVAGGSLFPLAEMVCSRVKRCHRCIKKRWTHRKIRCH